MKSRAFKAISSARTRLAGFEYNCFGTEGSTTSTDSTRFSSIAPVRTRISGFEYFAFGLDIVSITEPFCTRGDPYPASPDWGNLSGQTSMTPIPIYGSLGFIEYAYES